MGENSLFKNGLKGRLLRALVGGVLAGLVLAGIWAGRQHLQAASAQAYSQLRLLVEALYEIDNKYVQEKDNQALIYGAIRGMVASLDSTSSFLTPADYQELLQGSPAPTGTAGLELCIKDNVLTVVAPLEGGPAWEAGIKPDDHILKINQESTRNLTVLEAAKKLQGPPGTTIQLQILRNGMIKPTEVKVTLARPTVASVAHFQLAEGVLYLRVRSINDEAVAALQERLKQWLTAAAPRQGLILDLRATAGGQLTAARQLASFFIGPQLVYSLKGRQTEERQAVYGLKNQKLLKDPLPLVVLIDQGTAQAAEVVAAALQAQADAVLLGYKTFGQCGQSKIFPLKDGSAISINVAYCYTPRERLIQGQGLEPDVAGPGEEEKGGAGRPEAEEGKPRVLPGAKQIEQDPLVQQALSVLKTWPKGRATEGLKSGRKSGRQAASVPAATNERT